MRDGAISNPFPPLSLTRLGVLAIAGAATMAVASKLAVPFWPVYLTCQMLAVNLMLTFYPSRAAVAAMVLWGGVGAVFASAGAGWLAFSMGFSFANSPGYILGMIAGVWLVDKFRHSGDWPADGWKVRMTEMGMTMLLVHVLGTLWVMAFGTYAFNWASEPLYVAADVLKMGIALGLVIQLPKWKEALARFAAAK